MRRLAMLLALAAPWPAAAGEAWDAVSAQLFAGRVLLDGGAVIAIDAPYRTENDARTQVAAEVTAPARALIGRVWVVLDENPMPVSAIFDFNAPQPRFFFDATLRVNGPTPLHVVAETTDGRLFVAESFVKTSGQGACAAPPGTDPALALATLGEMTLAVDGALPGLGALEARLRKLDVDISHPSHSGMQMDQITLLYIPMRYVSDVDIALDSSGYVEVTGSISLSENPRLGLSVPGDTQAVDVTVTDTHGTVSTARKRLAGF